MEHMATELKAVRIHLSYPYVIAFSTEATNVYEIKTSALQHISSLTPPSEGFFREGAIYLREGAVIFDPSRDAIIIVEKQVHVWNLHDGQLQNTIGLFGTVCDLPIIYDNGRVLVTLADETEEEGEQIAEFWVLACNPFDLEPQGCDYLTQLRIAAPEQHQLYHHVHASAEHGVVVGEHISLTRNPLKLYYWSPEGQPYDESVPPAHSIDIPITLSDADSMLAQYATSIDDNRFALATLETVLGSPDAPGVHQTVIRAHSLPTLNILWQDGPIAGTIKHIYHLASQGVIIAFGKVSEGLDDDPDCATWIVALDAQQGRRLQFTKLNHQKIGKKIVSCDLTTSVTEEGKIVPSDNPDIVFVTNKGDVSAFSLAAFLEEGLPSDHSGALEKTVHSSGLRLKDVDRLPGRVSIGQKSVAALDDDGSLSVFTW
ncbi:hypothetical protein PM082_016225 [Marasmius tenuissimus]|nr:hypothetical protein PM082_016225 [Marasmius tenuissimus]